jgi:hypothetical protein
MVTADERAWAERPRPPVTLLGMVSIGFVAAGVTWLAAYLPSQAPLGPAIGCLVAAALVLLVNVVVLARQRHFAWWRFFQVARWGLLAYLVIVGMIEYAFIYDHTGGSVLVVMTLMLVIFAINPPILLAFTVARFEEAEHKT